MQNKLICFTYAGGISSFFDVIKHDLKGIGTHFFIQEHHEEMAEIIRAKMRDEHDV